MPSQDEITNVLDQAQQAVDALAQDVGGLVSPSAQEAPPEPAATAPGASCLPAVVPASDDAEAPHLARVRKLRVQVRVCLAESTMPVGEILKMVPGTILAFERTVDSDLDLLVANRKIGAGAAVQVNDRFGLRITAIGDARERLESLAG